MHDDLYGLTTLVGESSAMQALAPVTGFAPAKDQTMHSFMDAKTMAKALRTALAEGDIAVSHSDCLELVARQFGLPNWNMLAARIEAIRGDTSLALPADWFITNHTDEEHYRLGLDPQTPGAALIACRFDREAGLVLAQDSYAVLMQSVAAPAYRGKRLRLSASLRTEAADLGTIWMRIDEAPGRQLGFDNMTTRRSNGALSGTQGWTERSVVLDVPETAGSIHYGFFLRGYGRVWARAFRLEDVGDDVATTAGRKRHLATPANLDFSMPA